MRSVAHVREKACRSPRVGVGKVTFEVKEKETALFIRADRDLTEEALRSIKMHRAGLEEYILVDLTFATTLKPYVVMDFASPMVKEMAAAGRAAGVGPMAAVAGAIAEYVGRDLLRYSRQIVVENGGDIFLDVREPCHVAIYAGDSPLSCRLGLRVTPESTPLGVCTSAGTVGHSLSLGRADAACVLSKSAAMADAFATAVGNMVRCPADIPKALQFCQNSGHVTGVVVIVGEHLGAWGEVSLIELE